MNITEKVLTAAKRFKLGTIATGGGFDFVWRGLGKGEGIGGTAVDLVLGSTADPAFSPDELTEPSVVVAYVNDPEWQGGVGFEFPTALAAMDFMSSVTRVWSNEGRWDSDESEVAK